MTSARKLPPCTSGFRRVLRVPPRCRSCRACRAISAYLLDTESTFNKIPYAQNMIDKAGRVDSPSSNEWPTGRAPGTLAVWGDQSFRTAGAHAVKCARMLFLIDFSGF